MSDIPITANSFDQFLSQKKLMGAKCKQCGAIFAPPRPICLDCHSSDMEWVELSGQGKLAAFTVIGVGPPTMQEAGYDKDHPYCSGIVELKEGPKVSAQILNVDVEHPENIEIGTVLTVDFVDRGKWAWGGDQAKEQKTFLAFRA